MLSRQFIEKLKLWPAPQYKVAIQAGVHPGLLSKWIIGAQPVKYGDERLIRIGQILGLRPDQIFENTSKLRSSSTDNIDRGNLKGKKCVG